LSCAYIAETGQHRKQITDIAAFLSPPAAQSPIAQSFPNAFGDGSGGGSDVSLWSNIFGPLVFGSDFSVSENPSSGDNLSGTSTFTGHTLASLGLTPGQISTWSWGANATADRLRLEVDPVPAPLPIAGAAAVFFSLKRLRPRSPTVMAIPTLLELAVDGFSVAIRFSEALSATLPSINRFAVLVNGVRIHASTTLQALWMGVPVISLLGGNFVSRMGASFLSALGHRDWIATDHDHYRAIARELATQLGDLRQQRPALRQAMASSGLSDLQGYTNAFQHLLRRIWHSHCNDDGSRLLAAET